MSEADEWTAAQTERVSQLESTFWHRYTRFTLSFKMHNLKSTNARTGWDQWARHQVEFVFPPSAAKVTFQFVCLDRNILTSYRAPKFGVLSSLICASQPPRNFNNSRHEAEFGRRFQIFPDGPVLIRIIAACSRRSTCFCRDALSVEPQQSSSISNQ